MNRTGWNFLVDLLSLIAFFILISTGLLIRYVLPAGTGHSLALWGLSRHEWGDVHFWLALFIVAVMVLHIYLHWRWVVSTVRGKAGSRSGLRVGLILALMLLLSFIVVLPYFVPLEQTGQRGGEHGDHDRAAAADKESEFHIAGSMTLEAICEQTGLDAGVLLDSLGLPGETPLDEQLGRLSRYYGFEMETARETVRSLLQTE